MIHRKTVQHFHEAGHLHELTFSCYQRMPLLTNDAWREKLASCLDRAGEEAAMSLVAHVRGTGQNRNRNVEPARRLTN